LIALVTGGGGFVGGAVVRRLVERGDRVRSFSRLRYAELDRLGVECMRGDLSAPGSEAALAAACRGVDAVFHVAAKAGVWGSADEFRRANVDGTRRVLEACRKAKVRRLVFTSSPSVVFDGRDMEGVDESAPYPDHFLAPYPATKAEAEKLVLAANGPELATTALRPHLVWGPADPHIVPRLVDRARRRRLKKIGRRPCLVDSTYIDNAADAHLRAADRLAPGKAAAGRAYFISNGEPLPVWELISRILEAADAPPVTGTVSTKLAYAAGWAAESLYRLLRLRSEPPMTRFVAKELSTAHWFDLTAARRDLGYEPKVSIAEGLERLRAALRAPLPPAARL
jgi:2-alkyl-3-oxoalkanoate reductase